MHAFVVLGFVFPYQAKRLAWGTCLKWPILWRVGCKTLTRSVLWLSSCRDCRSYEISVVCLNAHLCWFISYSHHALTFVRTNIIHTKFWFRIFQFNVLIRNFQFLVAIFIHFQFTMVALCNRADHIWSPYAIGQTIYIFILSFVLSFFSSPNLSGRRLYVCHTSTHCVVLVRI